MAVAAIQTSSAMRSYFLIKRLHSLTGVFPVGVYLLEHLFANSFALKGPEAYDGVVRTLTSLPYLPFIEAAFIWIPLLFHGILGIVILTRGRANVIQYGYAANWMFLLQRVTGVFAFIFIAYHVGHTRLSHSLFGTEINFRLISGYLHNPWIFLLYSLGVLSSVFHFANGVRTALMTWGITIGEGAQRVSFAFCILLFAVLAIVGMRALLAFAV